MDTRKNGIVKPGKRDDKELKEGRDVGLGEGKEDDEAATAAAADAPTVLEEVLGAGREPSGALTGTAPLPCKADNAD